MFHDDVKVEIIETIRNEDDSELLTRLRTELLSWYNETIKHRRVQTADIYPQVNGRFLFESFYHFFEDFKIQKKKVLKSDLINRLCK